MDWRTKKDVKNKLKWGAIALILALIGALLAVHLMGCSVSFGVPDAIPQTWIAAQMAYGPPYYFRVIDEQTIEAEWDFGNHTTSARFAWPAAERTSLRLRPYLVGRRELFILEPTSGLDPVQVPGTQRTRTKPGKPERTPGEEF